MTSVARSVGAPTTILLFLAVTTAGGADGRVVGHVRLRVDEDPRRVLLREDADDRERIEAARLLDPLVGYDHRSRGLANVVVYLPEAPVGGRLVGRRRTRVVQATSSGLAPRLVVLTVGQPVTVSNLRPYAIHLDAVPRANPELVLSVASRSILPNVISFDTSEPRPFPVRWGDETAGHWIVLDHPYFAVTDGRGRFEIEGLPPGRHEFRVLHPFAELRTVPLVVRVEADRTTRVELRPSPVVLRRHEPSRTPASWMDPNPAHVGREPGEPAAPHFPFVGPLRPLPPPWPEATYAGLEDRSLAGLRRVLAGDDTERRRAAARALVSEYELAEVAETVVPLAVDEDHRVRAITVSALWHANEESTIRTALVARALWDGLPERHLRDVAGTDPNPMVDQLLPFLLERYPAVVLERFPGTRTEVVVQIYRELPGNRAAERLLVDALPAMRRTGGRPIAKVVRFTSDFAEHATARSDVRATLPERLLSNDGDEVNAAFARIDEVGPAAADELRDELIEIVTGRARTSSRRAAAIVRLTDLVHDPRVASLLWDVGHDRSRTTSERTPAVRALLTGLTSGTLTAEWRTRVHDSSESLEGTHDYLRAIKEIRAILAEQRRLRDRVERELLRELTGDLVDR